MGFRGMQNCKNTAVCSIWQSEQTEIPDNGPTENGFGREMRIQLSTPGRVAESFSPLCLCPYLHSESSHQGDSPGEFITASPAMPGEIRI